MKLRFTPRAARDLAEIADYLREHSPQAALRVRAAILESLQSLILFPHIGRQYQHTSWDVFQAPAPIAPSHNRDWQSGRP